MSENTQTAPYPTELEDLVGRLSYKPGWRFQLGYVDRGQGSRGLTFTIIPLVPDSLDPDSIIRVQHFFPVPPAAFNRNSWMRWLLDRILDVESHEGCEFFRIDDERVYAPHHSEGEDPYIVWQIGDLETARKRFTDR